MSLACPCPLSLLRPPHQVLLVERRYVPICQDLRYLLGHPRAADEMMCGGDGAAGGEARDAVGAHFGWWLELLAWTQHMAPLQRSMNQTPRDEDEAPLHWIHAFCLDIELGSCSSLVLARLAAPDTSCAPCDDGAGPSPPPALLRAAASAAWTRLGAWLHSCANGGAAAGAAGLPVALPAAAALLPEWEPRQQVAQVVSHHLPLHRILARLLLLGLQRGTPAEELVASLPLDAAAAEVVMEHPLRLQLLPLQLRLRWWVGNGRVPWAADRFYRSRLHREMGWAKDMLLLQLCAHALGPAAFLDRVLQRGVPGAPPGGTHSRASMPAPAAASTEVGLQQEPREASEVPAEAVAADAAAAAEAVAAAELVEPATLEELLQLLLQLLKGWGCTEAASLRSALVHQLALGPLAHSVLLRRLEPRWAEHSSFDAALQEAGVRVHGKYALRASLWCEVDPSHAFYTPEEQAQVEGRLHTLRQPRHADAADTPSHGTRAPPPVLPSLGVSAAGLGYLPSLGGLLLSEQMLGMLRAALSNARASSELSGLALHMLALAVQHAAAAPSPSEAGARYLARLGERHDAETSGGADGGDAGRSLAECLVRLDCAAQLPPSQRALLEQLLGRATAASAPLAAHVASCRQHLAEAEASAKSDQTSALEAREKRRQQAKAGRARLMASLATKQAHFAEGSGEAEGAEPTRASSEEPSAAGQARQAAEQAHLTSLLGDDALCVLCKDGLCAPDEHGEARLAGLIGRSCRQRLATPAVRRRQAAVSRALSECHACEGEADEGGTAAVLAGLPDLMEGSYSLPETARLAACQPLPAHQTCPVHPPLPAHPPFAALRTPALTSALLPASRCSLLPLLTLPAPPCSVRCLPALWSPS